MEIKLIDLIAIVKAVADECRPSSDPYSRTDDSKINEAVSDAFSDFARRLEKLETNKEA